MAIKQYLDKTGLQSLWSKVCWQDQDLLEKITANSNRIDEIVQGEVEVLYDTCANWDAQTSLRSKGSTIYVYTDARTVLGNNAARVKIGDGVTLLTNLPFIDEDIETAIKNLETRIDDKVGCRMDETTLQFYKD